MARDLKLGLSPEAIAERRNFIGGSDANIIMSGDLDRVHGLWEQKCGLAEPDDLSNILPVQMGSATEEFNRYWYEKQTGRDVTNEGLICESLDDWRRATLDGETRVANGDEAIFEAKHVNAFSDIDEVARRYMPQLHHNMNCAASGWAVLSVFIGTLKWEYYEIPLDDDYLDALMAAEQNFWAAVQNRDPIIEAVEIDPPKPPSVLRTIDMTGNNEWAALADDWLSNKGAKQVFDSAAKMIKELIELDVGKADGHGIICKRAKNGALTIREATQ